ncbi:hypothetical protein [Leptolinea tardivitalis]|uniref:hypothetical protein n=1 Tax=Leptolinea tardivitalis TaxID=229920 RepID=UPI001112BFB8|nr:hypothetical protein [Leptolinea tardivitalis]
MEKWDGKSSSADNPSPVGADGRLLLQSRIPVGKPGGHAAFYWNRSEVYFFWVEKRDGKSLSADNPSPVGADGRPPLHCAE